MHPLELRIYLVKDVIILCRMDHIPVERIEALELQRRIVEQAPLPAAVFEAVPVAGPREVDPFRMAEFIAHKGQVTRSAGCHRQQADYLVQSDRPVDHLGMAVLPHLVIHGGVCKTEDHRLVSH